MNINTNQNIAKIIYLPVQSHQRTRISSRIQAAWSLAGMCRRAFSASTSYSIPLLLHSERSQYRHQPSCHLLLLQELLTGLERLLRFVLKKAWLWIKSDRDHMIGPVGAWFFLGLSHFDIWRCRWPYSHESFRWSWNGSCLTGELNSFLDKNF